MKKIFLGIILILLSFYTINTFSYTKNEINEVMLQYYSKLDNKIPDINTKINKLELITKKINLIKTGKWDKINKKSRNLLMLLDDNLKNKILFYKEELANKKENINLSDLLNTSLDITNTLNSSLNLEIIKDTYGSFIQVTNIPYLDWGLRVYKDGELRTSGDLDFYRKLTKFGLSNLGKGNHIFKIEVLEAKNGILTGNKISGEISYYMNTIGGIDKKIYLYGSIPFTTNEITIGTNSKPYENWVLLVSRSIDDKNYEYITSDSIEFYGNLNTWTDRSNVKTFMNNKPGQIYYKFELYEVINNQVTGNKGTGKINMYYKP